MLARIAATIERYRMFTDGQTVAVAVSAGADSVCLLHALVELAPRWNLRLAVLHLDHNLRGEESRGDAEFVRALAQNLQLPVTVRSVDVGGCEDNLEEAARDARLAFFREQVTRGAADKIAVGHTRNDQAETVLFRFLRGAGTAGLAAVRPVTSDGIVRPLIEIDRADVEAYLRSRGLPWCEDSTNASPEFARNRIRHQLLPQLARDWNPAIIPTLANTADWALAEEEYWEAEVGRLERELAVVRPDSVLIRTSSLANLPAAAARRLVRRAFERIKGDLRGIDFGHVAAVADLASRAEGHGRVQAPGVETQRSFDWLRFGGPCTPKTQARDYRVPAPVPGRIPLPVNGLTISLELIEKSETSGRYNSVYNYEKGGLDWRTLSGCLELRNWKPGDHYQPRGSSGEEKIKTLFQEARIPEWERRDWPVLLDGDSIIWARKFGPAARFAARPESSVILVVQEYESGLGSTASIE